MTSLPTLEGMNPPAWQERSFEGRQVCFTALTGEEELKTSTGTRWAVFARVEIGSGLFKGAVYDKVPVYSPPLKEQVRDRLFGFATIP